MKDRTGFDVSKKNKQKKQKYTGNIESQKMIADLHRKAFWSYLIIALLIGIVLYGFITQILHHI